MFHYSKHQASPATSWDLLRNLSDRQKETLNVKGKVKATIDGKKRVIGKKE